MQCVSNGVTVEIGRCFECPGGRQEPKEAEMRNKFTMQRRKLMEELIHNREILVNVLIYHWRTNTSGCGCGWGVLGASHADHVVEVYEDALRLRQT